MALYNIPLQPINLQDNGFHLLVEMIVFGQPIMAVLDTGASRSVFDEALFKTHAIALETIGDLQANTIFSVAQTQIGRVPILKIGKLKIKDYEAVSIDLSAVNNTYAQLGHPLIGAIIGGDILMDYRAKIDYTNMLLRLYKS